MKGFVVFFTMVVLLIAGLAYGEFGHPGDMTEAKEKEPEKGCPVTQFTDNGKCMDCHQMILENGKPKFGLKEIKLENMFSGKPYKLEILNQGAEHVAYLNIGSIDTSLSNALQETSAYLYLHPEIRKLILEVHSGGGGVMSAWRAIGYIDEMRQRGILIETRCYGMAASAGVILLVSGDIGHRYAHEHAEIMIHKLWTFSMFSVSTPDSAEDKAKTLKHFQANINSYIAGRTNFTADELSDKTYHKDFWFSGKEALAFGVVDHLVGAKDTL
jgi:ATP-dependent Clp protease protease subunit